MCAQKSKYPDFTEVIGMASKFFCDVQKSVVEITHDYKEKRKETAEEAARAANANAATSTATANANAASAANPATETKAEVKATEPDAVFTAEVKVDVQAEKPADSVVGNVFEPQKDEMKESKVTEKTEEKS